MASTHASTQAAVTERRGGERKRGGARPPPKQKKARPAYVVDARHEEALLLHHGLRCEKKLEKLALTQQLLLGLGRSPALAAAPDHLQRILYPTIYHNERAQDIVLKVFTDGFPCGGFFYATNGAGPNSRTWFIETLPRCHAFAINALTHPPPPPFFSRRQARDSARASWIISWTRAASRLTTSC